MAGPRSDRGAEQALSPQQQTFQQTLSTLQTLRYEGFLQIGGRAFMGRRSQIDQFMQDLTRQYLNRRQSHPEESRFQSLQSALQTTRRTTVATMLRNNPVQLSSTIQKGFFFKRTIPIDNYLRRLP